VTSSGSAPKSTHSLTVTLALPANSQQARPLGDRSEDGSPAQQSCGAAAESTFRCAPSAEPEGTDAIDITAVALWHLSEEEAEPVGGPPTQQTVR